MMDLEISIRDETGARKDHWLKQRAVPRAGDHIVTRQTRWHYRVDTVVWRENQPVELRCTRIFKKDPTYDDS